MKSILLALTAIMTIAAGCTSPDETPEPSAGGLRDGAVLVFQTDPSDYCGTCPSDIQTVTMEIRLTEWWDSDGRVQPMWRIHVATDAGPWFPACCSESFPIPQEQTFLIDACGYPQAYSLNQGRYLSYDDPWASLMPPLAATWSNASFPRMLNMTWSVEARDGVPQEMTLHDPGPSARYELVRHDPGSGMRAGDVSCLPPAAEVPGKQAQELRDWPAATSLAEAIEAYEASPTPTGLADFVSDNPNAFIAMARHDPRSALTASSVSRQGGDWAFLYAGDNEHLEVQCLYRDVVPEALMFQCSDQRVDSNAFPEFGPASLASPERMIETARKVVDVGACSVTMWLSAAGATVQWCSYSEEGTLPPSNGFELRQDGGSGRFMSLAMPRVHHS